MRAFLPRIFCVVPFFDFHLVEKTPQINLVTVYDSQGKIECGAMNMEVPPLCVCSHLLSDACFRKAYSSGLGEIRIPKIQ